MLPGSSFPCRGSDSRSGGGSGGAAPDAGGAPDSQSPDSPRVSTGLGPGGRGNAWHTQRNPPPCDEAVSPLYEGTYGLSDMVGAAGIEPASRMFSVPAPTCVTGVFLLARPAAYRAVA